MTVTLSFLLPADFVLIRHNVTNWYPQGLEHTLNRVGLGELCQVREKRLRDLVPCLAFPQSQVDVGT